MLGHTVIQPDSGRQAPNANTGCKDVQRNRPSSRVPKRVRKDEKGINDAYYEHRRDDVPSDWRGAESSATKESAQPRTGQAQQTTAAHYSDWQRLPSAVRHSANSKRDAE